MPRQMKTCKICDKQFLKGFVLELTKTHVKSEEDYLTIVTLCEKCAPAMVHFLQQEMGIKK